MASLNYHRAGQGEPLVLIHGIGSRWQIWEPVIGGLSAERDVIAIDMPGFGASPMPPPGTPPGTESLVTLVKDFLDELGIEQPHVAGNSLGGLVALELARRGLVRSVTGVSPAGFANRPETRGARASLALTIRVARLLAPRARRLLRSPLARRLVFSGVVAHPDRMSPEAAAGDVRAAACAPWFEATLPTISPMAFQDGQRITVPITIAWGTKDRLLLPRQAKRAAAALPRARIVMLEDCGHVPTYDDPALVTRVLLEATAG